jgi:hypothetical protein
MKPVLLVAMLAGFLMPVYGQQQLCFSKNCAQAPATSFKLDRSDKRLNNLFQPIPSVPDYTPVTPLALSPSAKQFLHYSAPVDTGPRLGLVVPRNATASWGAKSGYEGTTRVHSSVYGNSSQAAGFAFSVGRGGAVLTPGSSKF